MHHNPAHQSVKFCVRYLPCLCLLYTSNTYDGQLYAIGATESSVAFYYNKDYLKECGVDTDDLDSRTLDNPITWDEMAEIAEKCTTDNYVGAHIIMDLSLIHI